ncbi:BTAD domain-containing putative transcriptional regulator [Williamsia soli]|uniref:BTAD domain-containing putative transcriptional regulator n=1 Tax=Williamsia soli TaxID=364929 RepID=UPI001A9EF0AF|nr:BTAD domain-containing putative transcriptional regulator [Williamsia soli]
MEFRDLGPLLIESDGLSRPPGGGRLSTVLAVLLTNAGEAVSAAALISAIWGADPPARSAKVLESHIWRLRKVLEPERGPRAAPTVLVTDPLGYRLLVSDDKIDSKNFAIASQSVRDALAKGDIDSALALSDVALARWRGPYCDDVVDTGWLAPVRARLADLRLDLVETRAAALQEAGQPERAVNELAVVIDENPLRERLWLYRIVGLYQSGRQAAALDSFGHIRQMLADELGVDPGPELRQLHQQILNHDERLRPRVSSVAKIASAEVNLPRRRSTIIGRGADESAVTALIESSPLVTITGPGGVGKTRLATEVGFTVRDSFPDGVWFVDLAPILQAESIPAVVANTLGLRPTADTALARLVREHVSSRRLLVVVDNCEHLLGGVADFVDQILDAGGDVHVLATSREPLEVVGEKRYALSPLPVPAVDGTGTDIGESSAVRLFLDRAAGGRGHIDLDGDDGLAVARICAAVGGLPLGIELAAARSRTFELREIADSLDGAPGHLARSGPGPQRHSSLLDTVDWGYRLAGHDQQVLHRRLAVLAGPFTLEAAARLCTIAPLNIEQALDLVGGLVHRSMLVSVPPTSPARRTTFFQLVPIRAHADRELDAVERRQLVRTRNRWVTETLLAAPHPGAPEQPEHYAWLEDNQSTVLAVLRSTLIEKPDLAGLAILWRLIFFWHDREQFVELLRWSEVADAAFGSADLAPFDGAVVAAIGGCAEALGHNTVAAERKLAQAIPVLADPPSDRKNDATRLLFVVAVCAWSGDVFEWSTRAAAAALELAVTTGDAHSALGARGILAAAALVGGDSASAVEQADSVLNQNSAVGNNMAALFANITHSIAAKFAGDGTLGLRYCDDVLRTQKRLGTHNFSESFETRGNHFFNAGRPDEAARNLGLSYALSQRQSREWPWHPGTDAQLEAVRAELGTDFDGHWNSGVRLGQVDPVQLISDLDLG